MDMRQNHMVPEATGTHAAMVELRGVSKVYGATPALRDVDLRIDKGEFVTLLGPSGSGKTTVLSIIAGMVQPTSGQVWIDGRDATHMAPSARGVGMVLQNYALMPHMSVFDNIAFPLRVRKLPRRLIEDKVHEVLQLIRLPDVARRRPRELSGGQQQRVALARCIVYNPSLILLDEPLGALDKKLREQMQLEIKRIHAELGITMLNVTHDQDEALTLSDRIVLMNAGRIEQQCAPEELYFRPATVFAADFIGEANMFRATVRTVEQDCVELTSDWGPLRAGRPAFALREGLAVKVLVRPENVDMIPCRDAQVNVAEGSLKDSIVLGGTIKHYIDCASGQVIVQEPNQRGRRVFERASRVCLRWDWRDALVLPGD